MVFAGIRYFLLAALFVGAGLVSGKEKIPSPEIALDRLVEAPGCWSLTPKELANAFHEDDEFGLVWLTEDKTRAKLSRYRFSNIEIDLSLFDKKVPVDEVVVDFEKGRVSVVSLSLFSRGDSASISAEDFQKRFLICGKKMASILGAKPQTRKANAKQGDAD